MDFLVNTVKQFCISHGFDHTYWLGYSGGLDSQVLLHLLAEIRLHFPLKLRVIHVHHGLSEQADKWASQCEATCEALQVDFIQRAVLAKPYLDKSPEEFARELRYGVFQELLACNDVLLTAHHQDDQAETMLLQMLRGAGPKGLAAMPKIKSFAKGYHARPLLNVSREELKTFALQKKLNWIEDDSNINSNFTRNFLRHDILTLLKNRWPSVVPTLVRVAENCAEAQQLLEEFAQEDLAIVKSFSDVTLSVTKLLKLTPARQRQVLRIWFQELHFPLPSALKIQQIQKNMLTAAEDKLPCVAWGGVELRRYRDDLYAMLCLNSHDTQFVFDWNLPEPLIIPGIGTLKANLYDGAATQDVFFTTDIKQVQVRFRQGGEKIKLPGRDHHHSLKKLFQDWGIPPWERERIPLIFVGEKLVSVLGWMTDEKYAGEENRSKYVLRLER